MGTRVMALSTRVVVRMKCRKMERLDQHQPLRKCSANLGFGGEEGDGAGRVMKFVCGLTDVFLMHLSCHCPLQSVGARQKYRRC